MKIHRTGSTLFTLLFLLGGTLLSTAGAAAGLVGPLWTARHSAPAGLNDAFDVVVDTAGNSFTVGRAATDRQTGETDLVIVKYSPTGQRLWSRVYDTPGDSLADIHAALHGGSQLAVTASFRTNPTGRDILAARFDASGRLVWEATYNGPNNGNEIPTALAVDAAGSVYIASTAESLGVFSTDILTLKLAAGTGELLWQTRFVGLPVDSHEVTAIAVSPTGGVFVTGRTFFEEEPGDYLTLRYAAASGAQVWSATYNGPGDGRDRATALALTPTGNVCVTGSSIGADGTADYATLLYSAAGGDPLWVARYSGLARGNDDATAVAVDSVGNVYVTGASAGSLGQARDFATVKYAGGTGAQLWAARYDGPGGEAEANGIFDRPVGIRVDADGNATVTGSVVTGSLRHDIGTVHYSATGQRQWLHLFDTRSLDDVAAALQLDGAGNVLVVGTSASSNFSGDRTLVTLKFHPTGFRTGAPPAPTLTFTEGSSDRLLRRRVQGTVTYEEVTTHSFRINSGGTLTEEAIAAFTAATPFSLSVAGFQFDGVLGDDPRYRPGKTSATFTENAPDGTGRTRKALTVKVSWVQGKLKINVTGTPVYAGDLLTSGYQDTPTRRITDSTTAALTLGDYTQEFEVAVTGKVTTREVRNGEFTLSTVKLSGKGTAGE